MSTRLHFVEKAMKDNDCVKKGESYYWWKFRFGGKHRSKTRPKPSALENSPFTSGVMAALEQFDDLGTGEDLQSAVESVKDELENIKSETEDKLQNMPDSLQQGPTGEMLQGRIDSLDELISELDSIDFDTSGIDVEEQDIDDKVGDREEDETDEEFEERREKVKVELMEDATNDREQEIIDEIQGCTYNGE